MSANQLPTASAPPSTAWGLPLYLSCGSVSFQGRRRALTDAVATAESFSVLSPPMCLDYFAVFDGHSSTAVAEHLKNVLHGAIDKQIQSELHVETPRFHTTNNDDVAAWWKTTIRKAFRVVDDEMGLLEGTAGYDADVGATALVALVHHNYMVFANCGFSKAVLCRGCAMVLTPENENAEGYALDGEEEEEEAPESKLLRAKETALVFGSFRYKGEKQMAPPEVVAVERNLGDEFLILATDGLWETLSPRDACFFVRQKLVNKPREQDAKGSPDKLAKELAQRAISLGSKDNVSVVIVIFRNFWKGNTRY